MRLSCDDARRLLAEATEQMVSLRSLAQVMVSLKEAVAANDDNWVQKQLDIIYRAKWPDSVQHAYKLAITTEKKYL